MKRCVMTVLLSFLLVSTTFITSNAAENDSKAYYQNFIPDTILLLDSFFLESSSSIDVVSENNEDRSIEFRTENAESYRNGDWHTIIENYSDLNYRIIVATPELKIEPRYKQNVSVTYISKAYILLKINGVGAADMAYNLCGTAKEDTATGVYSSAAMSFDVIYRPGGWSLWDAKLDYNTTYSSSNRSVTFEYVYLNVWASQSMNSYIARVDYDEVYLGRSFNL